MVIPGGTTAVVPNKMVIPEGRKTDYAIVFHPSLRTQVSRKIMVVELNSLSGSCDPSRIQFPRRRIASTFRDIKPRSILVGVQLQHLGTSESRLEPTDVSTVAAIRAQGKHTELFSGLRPPASINLGWSSAATLRDVRISVGVHRREYSSCDQSTG